MISIASTTEGPQGTVGPKGHMEVRAAADPPSPPQPVETAALGPLTEALAVLRLSNGQNMMVPAEGYYYGGRRE